jgi:hypothetical protein
MATFWERAAGIGDGANDLLDLELLTAGIALCAREIITHQGFKDLLQLPQAQADELQDFIYVKVQPAGADEGNALAINVRFILQGARVGLPALDSVSNVWAALGYTPLQ